MALCHHGTPLFTQSQHALRVSTMENKTAKTYFRSLLVLSNCIFMFAQIICPNFKSTLDCCFRNVKTVFVKRLSQELCINCLYIAWATALCQSPLLATVLWLWSPVSLPRVCSNMVYFLSSNVLGHGTNYLHWVYPCLKFFVCLFLQMPVSWKSLMLLTELSGLFMLVDLKLHCCTRLWFVSITVYCLRYFRKG